jgi:hypothetical protein
MLQNAQILGPGIVLYKNVFKKSLNIIERLEKAILESNGEYKWNQAYTGWDYLDLSYRDCFDHKIKKNSSETEGKSKAQNDREQIWQDCKDAQMSAIQDYRNTFSVAPLQYWESMNFIKYGQGQHFREHSDHGYSYIATLSSVGYLNDDYEGGELYFNKLGVGIKPEAGDLVLFPSAFIYSHTAMPVKSGMKYSVVTMLDYTGAPHGPEYEEIEKKYIESGIYE